MKLLDNAFSPILLRDYAAAIIETDRLTTENLTPVLMGIFGEVGGIMAAAKKKHREKGAYYKFDAAVVEEFGDTLWYFSALARRTDTQLDVLFFKAMEQSQNTLEVATCDVPGSAIAHVYFLSEASDLDSILLELGECAAAFLPLSKNIANAAELMVNFARCYLRALKAADINFSEVVRRNLDKVRGRFLAPDFSKLPTFDQEFIDDERLPMQFEIQIEQRKSGQSYLKWNGVFIGDPLTDNIADPDGYRFHDVFHLAYAAMLHWSPVFRALIKHKRKSDKNIDETQDGGRAVVVEEGLTAWLFSGAKQLNFFEGQTNISLDTLKIVQQFVQGYEVEKCPLKLWEDAILAGYAVFRQVRDNNGGTIICDRHQRSITFKSKSEIANESAPVC